MLHLIWAAGWYLQYKDTIDSIDVTLDPEVAEFRKRPESFALHYRSWGETPYHEQDDRFWGHVTISHRDADLLMQANREAIVSIFEREVPDEEWHLTTYSHWAVGWTEVIELPLTARIDRRDDPELPSVAWVVMTAIQASLESYAVLDEALYSEMEWNDFAETVEWYLDDMDVIEDAAAEAELVDRVCRHLFDTRSVCNSDDLTYPIMEEVRAELGLAAVDDE